MKNLLFSVLLLPASVFAQQQQQQPQGPVTVEKPIVCVETSVLIEALKENKNNELPVWAGNDKTSNWGIIANEQTGEWTIVQFTENLACFIGSGSNHRLAPRESS